MTPAHLTEKSEEKIRTFKNRLVLNFTPSQAAKFDSYIAETGLNKNFVVDRAIEDFIDARYPVVRENDARYLCYIGEKKTARREVSISDVIEAILNVKVRENRISRSALAAQATLLYIGAN